MDRILVINMQSMVYNCGMCDEESEDKYAVPFVNGEPVPECESDGGYRSVCKPCFEDWERTINQGHTGR